MRFLSVAFGLPYLLIELFDIGMPVMRTVGRSVYGHVTTKFSRMGSLPHFFTHGALLRARELLYQILFWRCICLRKATILDKTVEKIVYLDSIFPNIVAVPVLPSPPSAESNVVVYSKESLIPGRLWEATLNWGKGFSFRK